MHARSAQPGPADPCADEGCCEAGALVESVTLEAWSATLEREVAARGRSISPFQRRVRAELGLPIDRPVVMSGHQAEIWHPGIFAKWCAGVEISRRIGGVFAWLHVDQDTNEPGVIECPALDAEGTLVKRAITLIEPSRDVPTGSRPARRIDPERVRLAQSETLFNPSAVERLIELLNAHADAPTLALQFGRAAESLASRASSGAEPVFTLTTTDLSRTSAFGDFVSLIREDAPRAISSHNRAAASVPQAGIRALGLKGEGAGVRAELPLWRVATGSVRTPVMLSQLDSIPPEALRPRALLMTGLARLGACDLFLHGTGGGVYDRVTDAWFEAWLGTAERTRLGLDEGLERGPERPVRLAPVVVASATARLAFGPDRGGVTPIEARIARHRAHAARHDPAILGDEAAAGEKRSLVEAIRASEDRGERLRIYRRMHALLEEVREAKRSRLHEFERLAADAARRAAEHEVVRERAWPISLYPLSTLEAVASGVRSAIG